MFTVNTYLKIWRYLHVYSCTSSHTGRCVIGALQCLLNHMATLLELNLQPRGGSALRSPKFWMLTSNLPSAAGLAGTMIAPRTAVAARVARASCRVTSASSTNIESQDGFANACVALPPIQPRRIALHSPTNRQLPAADSLS